MPSLQSAVAPLGGFAVAVLLVAVVFVVVVAGLLAAVLVVVVAGLLVAVFDAVFDAVFVAVFVAILEFEVDIVFDLFAFEAFELVAAPPQANVNAINDKRVTESISLFFIYFY